MPHTATRVASSQQKRYGNTSVMSSSVPNTIYECAVRCAELNGYETMSQFVRDAIIEKVQASAIAMNMACMEYKSAK